jgi:hypothetical protein
MFLPYERRVETMPKCRGDTDPLLGGEVEAHRFTEYGDQLEKGIGWRAKRREVGCGLGSSMLPMSLPDLDYLIEDAQPAAVPAFGGCPAS